MSATTFWRIAGMSYVQYVAVSSATLRTVLKEPMKTKALARGSISYNSSPFVDGIQGAKTAIETIAAAAAK